MCVLRPAATMSPYQNDVYKMGSLSIYHYHEDRKFYTLADTFLVGESAGVHRRLNVRLARFMNKK